MIADLPEKRHEDQKVVVGSLLDVVNRPTGCARKSLDINRDDVTGFTFKDNIHRLFVAQRETGITAKPVEHGEYIELGSEVGIVCRHILLANT